MPRDKDAGLRLRALFRRSGYWKGDRPDVGRFCREKGYLPQSVYAWLQGVEPRHDALRRLAADLGCRVEWWFTDDRMGLAGQGAVASPSSPAATAGRSASGNRPGLGAAGGAGRLFDAGPLRNLRDVTGRLERMEAGLQAFFEIYPDFLLWLDGDGTVVSATPGKDFEPMVPLHRQIGSKQWDLVPPHVGRMWKEALPHVRQTGRPYIFEIRIPIKGKLRIRECRLAPMARHGFLAVIRDITELRKLQEQTRGRRAPGSAT